MASQPRIVGKHVAATVGLRVRMQEGYKDQGVGTVTSVHANGGYVSVKWDNGSEDKVYYSNISASTQATFEQMGRSPCVSLCFDQNHGKRQN
jgi:hypothetical protein